MNLETEKEIGQDEKSKTKYVVEILPREERENSVVLRMRFCNCTETPFHVNGLEYLMIEAGSVSEKEPYMTRMKEIAERLVKDLPGSKICCQIISR